jgi:hypothetical protein
MSVTDLKAYWIIQTPLTGAVLTVVKYVVKLVNEPLPDQAKKLQRVIIY